MFSLASVCVRSLPYVEDMCLSSDAVVEEYLAVEGEDEASSHNTHTLSFSPSPSHSLFPPFSLPLPLSLSPPLPLSSSPSLFLSLPPFTSLFHTHTHTLSHILSLPLSFALYTLNTSPFPPGSLPMSNSVWTVRRGMASPYRPQAYLACSPCYNLAPVCFEGDSACSATSLPRSDQTAVFFERPQLEASLSVEWSLRVEDVTCGYTCLEIALSRVSDGGGSQQGKWRGRRTQNFDQAMSSRRMPRTKQRWTSGMVGR